MWGRDLVSEPLDVLVIVNCASQNSLVPQVGVASGEPAALLLWSLVPGERRAVQHQHQRVRSIRQERKSLQNLD